MEHDLISHERESNMSDVTAALAGEVFSLYQRDPEAARAIETLFRVILGRSADLQGLSFYTGQMRSGRSAMAIAKDILASPEYQAKYQRSVWWQSACDNAREPRRVPSLFQSRAAYCAELAARPSVRQRYPLEECSAFAGHFRPNFRPNAWQQQFGTVWDVDRAYMKETIAGWSKKPTISILMPVYNTPAVWLEAAISSCQRQVYPFWELCISDDASTSPHVLPLLEKISADDRRIKIYSRPTNGGISANTNASLLLAKGEFVALLDADDELPEDALFWVAKEIVTRPDVDLIFSDEDKIDAHGCRYDAYFKSDWNPALMLSQNAFSHLGVFRKTLVEAVGGFRPELDGSQDHDLVLRCAERTSDDKIRHIPRVLYHWRALPSSTASSGSAKPYAMVAGQRAVAEALQRRGVQARVNVTAQGYYQVDYEVPQRLPKVSIIIPTTCRLHLIKPCIEALFSRTSYSSFELILVVSDKSLMVAEQRDFLKKLEEIPSVRLFIYEDRPFNFSWLNNEAVKIATGNILCLMNDDVEPITPDWLERLVVRLGLPNVAVAGPMMYYPDDRIQHGGVILGAGRVADHSHRFLPRGGGGYFGRAALEQDLSCVTAGCLVVRREVFEQVGGFDETLAVAFNDVDFCIRIREAGWRIVWTPAVEMYHYESASLGRHDSDDRRETFLRETDLMLTRWGKLLEADPFYNPNLSLEDGHFFEVTNDVRLPDEYRMPRTRRRAVDGS